MKSLLLLFCFLFFSEFGFAQKILLEGNYQGKNLYIQNPITENENFCTDSIVVNSKKIDFDNTSAYEIKLTSLGFQTGEPLKIEIFHKPDCQPKVIQEMITPKNTFEIVSISIDSSAVLHWISKNEINKLPYTIEQFRWNKWIKVGEVGGKGGVQQNEYSFQTIPHSGENRFRVKQIDYKGQPRPSKPAEFLAPELNINLPANLYKLADELEFNKETMYELYDQSGNLVRKGSGKKIDLKGLKRGTYYINYDNKTSEVNKFW